MQSHKRLNHIFLSHRVLLLLCVDWLEKYQKEEEVRKRLVRVNQDKKVSTMFCSWYSYCALCCFSFYSILGVTVPDCTSYFLLYNPKISIVTRSELLSLRESTLPTAPGRDWHLKIQETGGERENIWMSFDFQYSHLLFLHASFDCHDNGLGGWVGWALRKQSKVK